MTAQRADRTLRGLRNDPTYQALAGARRAEYEARYRQTMAGRSDELNEALQPIAEEIKARARPVLLRLDRLIDRVHWKAGKR